MVILTPEGGEAEGLGVVRPRASVTGAELLPSLPFHLLEVVLRPRSISGWAKSFGRGKSSQPGPLTGGLGGSWLWLGMTLCKDTFITCSFPDKASAELPQHPSTPHPRHSLTLPPHSQTPGCSSTERDSEPRTLLTQTGAHFQSQLSLLTLFSLLGYLSDSATVPYTAQNLGHLDPGLSPQKDKGQAPHCPSLLSLPPEAFQLPCTHLQ